MLGPRIEGRNGVALADSRQEVVQFRLQGFQGRVGQLEGSQGAIVQIDRQEPELYT